MSLLDGLRHRAHVLLRGELYTRDVERELRFHTELDVLSRSEGIDAELSARRALGNATYYREEVRRMTLTTWFDRIRQDATYAARGLKRSPGFTLAVVLTLGLGIGVNGAMFSLLDRVFLKVPDGVEQPRDVRRIYQHFREGKSATRIVLPSMAYPQFRAVRASLDSSVALAGFIRPESVSVRDGATRFAARRSLVTGDYFRVLGVRPAAGRVFGLEEADIATPARVAVISDAFWRRAFDRDRVILGKRVKITGNEYVIVGVTPPGFTGIDVDAVDVWVPASNYEGRGGGGGPWYNTFGASFNVIVRTNPSNEERILTQATNAIRPIEMRGVSYDSTVVLATGPTILALGPGDRGAELTVATRVAGISLMVLIIACANVSNLLLLRASKRRREIAVRRALGVSRMRLIEQLTVESVLLALLGGAVAVVFSVWAGAAVRRLVLPRVQWADGPVDLRTTAFIALVSILVGCVAGLLPALQAMKTDLLNSLKAGSRNSAYRGSRLRSTLLALQAALAVVLLVGSGLFMRSLDVVQSIDVGFARDNMYVIRPQLDNARLYGAELQAAIPEVAKRLEAMNGVEAVAFTSVPPLQGASFRSIKLLDRDTIPQLPGDYGPSIAAISPGFFKASGLALRKGRDFNPSDARGSQRVMIISESLARLYWPGESAIGKCIVVWPTTNPCSQIVGISADPHRRTIIEAPIGQLYVPTTQSSDAPSDLVVRVKPGHGPAMLRAAETMFRPMFAEYSGMWARSFSSVLDQQTRAWRLGATLFTALGALALIVAAVGVYSVVAYGASQRTNEMGIRIALGARTRDIIDVVLADGVGAVAVGIVVGIAASLALGRFVAALLFGVLPNDPGILVGASVLLGSIGIAACVIPGWRASRVDPATSLRVDG